MNEVCEHGHQARKCEVCELTDEIVRLREAVRVLAEELRGKCMDRAVNDHWAEELNEDVMTNPIAAAAVRKASE